MGNSIEIKGSKLLDEIKPPTNIHLFHDGVLANLNGDEDKYYNVSGVIYQHTLNTQLPFNKNFETEEGARLYLEEMAKINPISEILLTEVIERELCIYI